MEKYDIEVDDYSKSHLANIGSLIEDLETSMREHLDALYILKTRDVVHNIRSAGADVKVTQLHVSTLNAAVLGHGKARKMDSEV